MARTVVDLAVTGSRRRVARAMHEAEVLRLLEVDVLWPEHRVIVELDGEHVHGTCHAFHADRARDAALAARGYVVIRLTWRGISREPEAVAEELRQILRRRPPA